MSKNRMIKKYMFTGKSLHPKTCKCSLISSLFSIRLAQACFFFRCGETVTKREQFNDLSIDLPRRKKFLPSRSIQDSLDLFFRVCTLRGFLCVVERVWVIGTIWKFWLYSWLLVSMTVVAGMWDNEICFFFEVCPLTAYGSFYCKMLCRN